MRYINLQAFIGCDYWGADRPLESKYNLFMCKGIISTLKNHLNDAVFYYNHENHEIEITINSENIGASAIFDFCDPESPKWNEVGHKYNEIRDSITYIPVLEYNHLLFDQTKIEDAYMYGLTIKEANEICYLQGILFEKALAWFTTVKHWYGNVITQYPITNSYKGNIELLAQCDKCPDIYIIVDVDKEWFEFMY